MSTYDWTFEHDVLNSVIAKMQQAVLSRAPLSDTAFRSGLVQAGWLATFLANSHEHKHRRKALLFAALAKTTCEAEMAVDTMCYTIFSRVGALPAAKHLTSIVGDKQEYTGPSLGPLSDEFLASYAGAYSELGGGLVLTEFQNSTARLLRDKSCGVLSAPTSAGKSFIVHEYVKTRLRSDPAFVALFIVPTKALIAQTCAIYRRLRNAEDIDFAIHSSIPDNMNVPTGRAVLALTQERCIRLLSTSAVSSLSLVFADEIQSLEKGDRGALLEYVLHELRAQSPQARLFAAGPFIANGEELGHGLFDEECPAIDTEDTPVSQMVLHVAPVRGRRSLEVRVVETSLAEHDFVFELPTDRALYSRWKSSSSDAVCDAIQAFANDNPSIVYAKGPGTAQRWARRYSENLPDEGEIPAETRDLITYLRDSIHPNCSLIQCLKRRIAYHHGGVPDFVREEIEELYIQREIDVLFCTSTLLEGVNLPADKIFIVSPAKADEALTPFEFKNLTGRAGRLDQHLCGMVYCACTPRDDTVNPFEEFRGDTQKEVLPTVDERLAESYEAILDILAKGKPLLPEEDVELRGTVTVLRARFLCSREHAEAYLRTKKLTDIQKNGLLDALSEAAAMLTMPSELALRNPYVDPVLQDLLYAEVNADPQKWAIRRERGFSTDLEAVFKLLDGIFHIISEIGPRGNPDYYRHDLLTFAKLWLHGKPFREIVTRALPRNLRSDSSASTEDVDKAIKKAMDFITRDISFVTAKYFSVLADMLTAVVPESEAEDLKMTLALPVMLELGCSDPKTLALITACVPRGAAIKIGPMIPDEVEDPVVWLTLHQRDRQFRSLPSIYGKILRRNGIWA